MTNIMVMAELLQLIATSPQTVGMIVATNAVTFETNVTTYTDSGPAAPSSQFRSLAPEPVLKRTNFDLIASGIYVTNSWIMRQELPPRERWTSSNVWKITTIDFPWHGKLRQIEDRELVTNHVWHFRIKEEWEVVK